ncbi:MAG: hypothetical protein A2W61_04035 [Deltaproteobacteria bacterium RIFCSPLOWO2_01_44_7]|nr:MAG: hypothetical protein A2712_01785 [Deltaproteobacteria bacterium RIFCSPHIGHO2_01_FULL_43_49]OGQ15142.1 MAG: hypothetical protein A3D22_03690 [Deltaproteobacteria bacterium RIFCSPHIGHO2_02_FULL_44_53]OGQ27237.1 MAG: hypothetical protein A3D98_02380 [Deltaproteobacteria bacterium RIFCSPHIGHO2_12_FULL_44_21]OGQ31659.1 MAG: hypothetical protein A2979_04850 [Deltaproteobacteria bacterium RIFCSPLOWO2_01_FULL_45_74]OGQ42859.1 MAG: hypothetical protein A3I70_07155 [Deltaproteobacteria bacterium 
MILSDDRINFLSHRALDVLKAKGGVQNFEEKKLLFGIKQAIHEFGALLDGMDDQIRQKIATLKRQVPEGSREWDLLYRQYFEEELHKKGL